MNLTRWAVDHPYLAFSLAAAVAVLGLFGMMTTPRDLFPDTTPPQVLVVTVRQGASAPEMSHTITKPVERELSGLDGVANITSTTGDGVSSVKVEFRYDKSAAEAVTEVRNSLAAVTPSFPAGTSEPLVYSITQRTAPIVTVALAPKSASGPTLAEIRLLAENQVRDTLLSVQGVGDVEVFGGHQPAVTVRADRDRLTAAGLSLKGLTQALAERNVSIPLGRITTGGREEELTLDALFPTAADIGATAVGSVEGGSVLLREVASVTAGTLPQRSIYHGNGRPAIAVNVMRTEGADTAKTVDRVQAQLERLRARLPDIRFAVTDSQKPLIDLNLKGMYWSLAQAVLLTVGVIFLFLADVRAALISSMSIALSFLASLAVLRLTPYTINMVTLSGMIVAVGMVVDASVVVLENLYRVHAKTGKDVRESAIAGTKEVALSITAGMLTTIVVLLPVMGASGYTSRVLRPLNITIFSTLAASLLAALTIIPLLASIVLKKSEPGFINTLERQVSRFNRVITVLIRLYQGMLKFCLRRRLLTLAAVVLFVMLTMRLVVPLLGGEMMPAMDTGIAFVEFETPVDRPPEAVEETLSAIERRLLEDETVLALSSQTGSEPQAASFGGGAVPQSGKIKVQLVPRTEREETIWEIMQRWERELEGIEGLRRVRITEYGATPIATTKAPLDIIISGPDITVLDSLADKVMAALEGVRGLADVHRSWRIEKKVHTVTVDPLLAAHYGTTAAQIAGRLSTAMDGTTATMLRVPGFSDIPVRVAYQERFLKSREDVAYIPLHTGRGPVPLTTLGKVNTAREAPVRTREGLTNTVDVTGVNRVRTISHVTGAVQKRLAGIRVPPGYTVETAGSASDLGTSKTMLLGALLLGVVLLYLLLVSLFSSLLIPLVILSIVPPAVAGGLWGLLLFDKPMCMNAAMGFILLAGTIVNNSILLLDFIVESRKQGHHRMRAVLQSVALRTRPILMTATSTIIGLTPLVMEWAVGLERMSPLGIAAATGLLLGTVLTMVLVPVIYITVEDARNWVAARLGRGARIKP